MTALPKRKLSRSRQGNRSSHSALRSLSLSICPQCRAPKLPHRACPSCGTYHGRQVLKVEAAQ